MTSRDDEGSTPLHSLVVGIKRHDARVLAQPPRADDDDDDAGEDDDFGDKAVAKLMLVLMAAAPPSLIDAVDHAGRTALDLLPPDRSDASWDYCRSVLKDPSMLGRYILPGLAHVFQKDPPRPAARPSLL